MNKGHKIAEGKTKVLYEAPGQPDLAVMTAMDSITAGDGARRDVIDGKGRLAAKTTARVFRMLNLCGFPTHYVSGGEDDDDNEILVRRCNMVPLEVVVRGVAAGSFVKRKPGIARGTLIVPRLIEFFFKDDANHDPLIEPDAIVAQGIANANEIAAMTEIARMVYEVLAHAWRRRDVLLVDLKLEFGRLVSGENKGSLVIADVIDNDSWRLWPQGREELMLDKQMYRNLADVRSEDLDRVRAAYETVAEAVGTFPQMRPGMVVVLTDGAVRIERANEIARAVQAFGLPTGRNIVSLERVPGHVLQVLQQVDATFARVVYITVADERALSRVVAGATVNTVLDAALEESETLAMAAAKTLGLDDSILFGRVLLTQANQRAAVLQADAALNLPPPNPGIALA